jgi:hypothetical protein
MGDCLLWAVLMKIIEVVHIFLQLFPYVSSEYVLCNFDKNGLGYILGDFFTNSSGHPGVDVMITIFRNFYPFSAKKLAFFSKTNVTITIFAKTSFVLRQKRQYFR